MTTPTKTGIPTPTPQNTDKALGVVVQVVDQLQGTRGLEAQRAVRLFEFEELKARIDAIGTAASAETGAVDAGNEYVHTQTTASDIWTINHNLGRRVSISVFSPGGVEMIAQVLTVSVYQSQVLFDGPYSGYAIAH